MFLQVDLRVNEMRLLQSAQKHLENIMHHSKQQLNPLLQYILRNEKPKKYKLKIYDAAQ